MLDKSYYAMVDGDVAYYIGVDPATPDMPPEALQVIRSRGGLGWTFKLAATDARGAQVAFITPPHVHLTGVEAWEHRLSYARKLQHRLEVAATVYRDMERRAESALRDLGLFTGTHFAAETEEDRIELFEMYEGKVEWVTPGRRRLSAPDIIVHMNNHSFRWSGAGLPKGGDIVRYWLTGATDICQSSVFTAARCDIVSRKAPAAPE